MDTATAIAAFRERHPIVPIEEEHPDFGRIARCQHCGIRVHWIVKGYRHDLDEVKALLDQEYGGAWGFPKERSIERISADFTAEVDEDEPRDFDREGQPEWSGQFR